MAAETGLADEQRRALARLKAVPGASRLVLAGGTGVAFHLHHRRSVDLDLFGDEALDLDALRAAIAKSIPEVEVISMTDATLRLRIESGAVDIVRYPYAALEAPEPGPEGFAVAGLRDLAAMKLAAIANRGLRRDFWDLHAIVNASISLREAADAYQEKFRKLESDLYHVIRSLTYFDDAEGVSVWPRDMTPALWAKIKTFFRAQTPALLDRS